MSEETSRSDKKITALVAAQAAYKGDTAGRLDLLVQMGDAAMELTRLSGAEGRKGKG